MKDLTDKKLELLEAMLDDRIDLYGVLNTIQYLLDNDFTKEDLLEMGFDEEDINAAIEEDEEDEEEEYYSDVHYEVWALGYDAEGFCTDLELLLGTYQNKKDAIERAKNFENLEDLKKATTETIELPKGYYVDILVETIKNGDPANANIDTVYVKGLI